MNKVKQYTLLFAVVILPQARAMAQEPDLKSILENIRVKSEGSGPLHLQMTMKVFENANAEKAVMTERVEIRKQGESYRCRYGNNEFLANEKMIILADHQAKEITYIVREKNKMKEELLPNMGLDSILGFYSNAHLVNDSEGMIHFRCEECSDDIDTMDVLFDGQSRMPRMISYRYTSGQGVSFDFELFDLENNLSPDIFSEKNYLKKIKGKWQVSDALGGYHLSETETKLE